MKKILTKKGFTLIELIVVIAILAILAAILIPSLTSYLEAASDAKNEANARSLYSEAALEAATEPTTFTGGTYTADTLSCTSVVDERTITSFTCTLDGAAYTLTFTP